MKTFKRLAKRECYENEYIVELNYLEMDELIAELYVARDEYIRRGCAMLSHACSEKIIALRNTCTRT